LPAVPELHLRQIARYCEQRVPEHARDQIQVSYRTRWRSVTILERRPPWRADFGSEWSSRPVAQLRWTSSPDAGDEGSWRLYWADRNSRWHLVPDVAPASAPGPLLAFIDRHPAAFWG
jgi:Protein of unknown function (DUF3024)